MLMAAVFRADGGGSVAWSVALAVVKVFGLAFFTIVVGGRTIPWMLAGVVRTQSRELFTLAVLATALGIAVCSALVFGVSMALGALLAGLVVGRSDFSVRAASQALPMRDAFAVLFFVSVGMLLDPRHLVQHPAAILTTLAVVMIGKPLAALAIVRLFRYPLNVGLSVAVALAQIGEFSFIVATRPILDCRGDRVDHAEPVAVCRNWSCRRLDQPARARRGCRQVFFAGAGACRHAPRRRRRLWPDGEDGDALAPGESGHANGNRDEHRYCAESPGIDVIHGDATRPDTLAAARVAEARTFIVSVSGLPAVEEALRNARRLNPRSQILARTD
jgi:CPA2 family monovalent cation:H+ antiporter-2